MAEQSSHLSLTITPHARAALPAATALSNPYAQPSLMQYHISSHYAEAYMNFPAATTPALWGNGSFAPDPLLSRHTTYGSMNRQSSQADIALPTSAAWYQPGNNKCTLKGCSFTASRKTLEIHMMDRHLIYPPGWEMKQKKHDWDADPSLKGKPIPIQGTTLILDSPEVVEAWIAERKKRWPTSSRVEEKKRKMEEAISRGQLSVGDNSLRKRRRIDKPLSSDYTSERGRYSSNQVRGRSRGLGPDAGWRGRAPALFPRHTPQYVTPTPLCPDDGTTVVAPRPDTETESDAEPETASTKRPVVDTRPPIIMTSDTDGNGHGGAATQQTANHIDRRRTKKIQPMKKEIYNPFVSRPTLLRNLLLPEIRVTISNLSQAVRFLVDNGFLQGVELQVGEADERMIEVISSSIATS